MLAGQIFRSIFAEILMMKEKLYELMSRAGETIMKIYSRESFEGIVEWKDDRSPLTLADKASNEVLVAGLKEILDIPILSEELKSVDYESRKDWERFWLVDPLDGTKEFIKRNGEFTVNVALIQDGRPVLGMITAPEKGWAYFGEEGGGAEKNDGMGWGQIHTTGFEEFKDLKAVGSRSHASEEENEVMARCGVIDKTSIGSALKFCLVAEGQVDLYYRHGPTMEWDTGAGQAILEAAGGSMYKGNRVGEVFSYNKEQLLNGSFIAFGRRF